MKKSRAKKPTKAASDAPSWPITKSKLPFEQWQQNRLFDFKIDSMRRDVISWLRAAARPPVRIDETDEAILGYLRSHPTGATVVELSQQAEILVVPRTILRRLRRLETDGVVFVDRQRWYLAPEKKS